MKDVKLFHGCRALVLAMLTGMLLAAGAAEAAVLTVNGGKMFTNYPTVQLSINAADYPNPVQSMRFSADDATWSAWEPVAATKSWTVATPLNLDVYSVFLQFLEQGGATSASYGASTVYDDLIDTTFSDNQGVALLGGDGNDTGDGIAVQPDGKLLVVSTLAQPASGTSLITLWRLTTGGLLDGTFNAAGTPGAISFTGSSAGTGLDKGAAVALQSDGKIVVLGTVDLGNGNYAWQVRRFNTDGTVDGTFNGNTGYYQEGATGANEAAGLAIQTDDRIMVIGSRDLGTGVTKIEVLRLNADGTLDSAFNGGTGVYRTGSETSGNRGRGVALQSDGKILLVGTYAYAGGTSDLYVERLLSDGTRDSFNGLNGAFFGGGGNLSEGRAIAVQSDGKIVVAGDVDWGGGDTDLWVLRLNDDGTKDTTFDSSIGDYVDGGTGADRASALVVQPDDRIVVVGTFDFIDDTDIWVLRLNADGTGDPTIYNFYGYYYPNASGNDEGHGVALQADGNIVLAGTFTNPLGDTDIHVNRIFANKQTLTTAAIGSGSIADNLGALAWSGSSGDGDYIRGDSVTITATPAAGSVFTGWSGACSGTTPTCTLTMAADQTAIATFALEPPAAPTGLAGTPGNGAVALTWNANSETGITGYTIHYGTASGSLGSTVTVGTVTSYTLGSLNNGTTYYVAIAALKSGVEGPLSDEIVVTPGLNLAVTFAGSGSGTVTSTPAGISCTGDCQAVFTELPVTLLATPSAGSLFSGWSGGCTGTGDCTVNQYGPVAVTATFTATPPVRLTTGTTAYYGSIAEALAAASGISSCTIDVQATAAAESLVLQSALAVLLRGGYDASFTPTADTSVLLGLTISAGSLTLDNIVIR
ncbi:fibronectin type III [Geotalea uraniireducens]|uniref:Fibronectin type III n=1 Tax=Geotalea uraniireducens TaxID=351604 RepID=A0ABN6VPI1_9BACT|nr:fibronectin type III domain-containing protein [Geotalea uraniireducens]BDV42198.1 fibronectin type III [Geotalea uraniireducens]